MASAAFVFLDETGAATNMVRRYGWGLKGKRLVDAAPHGHWRSTTLIAGLRATGIVAPLVLDGPLSGQIFRAYVEQFLAPALARGDLVVMDNLPIHLSAAPTSLRGIGPSPMVAGVREAITAVGASILYLPAYAPDLNPIEQLFAKLKALLRKTAARTRDSLWEVIGRSLDGVSPAECRNYLENAGYALD
jgi:transposase